MFNLILVAIDASQYSLRVVPTALEVAKRFHSHVFVLPATEHDRGRAAVLSVETPSEGTRLVVDAVALMRPPAGARQLVTPQPKVTFAGGLPAPRAGSPGPGHLGPLRSTLLSSRPELTKEFNPLKGGQGELR